MNFRIVAFTLSLSKMATFVGRTAGHTDLRFRFFYKSTENVDNDPIVNANIPFKRSINFQTGNTCMPIDYFDFKDTNGADRRGCILQENLNGLTKGFTLRPIFFATFLFSCHPR